MTDGHLDSDRLAAWTLSLAWAEHQSWASVGRWATAASLDGVTATLGPVSARHGRRADQLRALWPQRRGGVDGAASLSGPPTAHEDPLDGLVGSVIDADGSFGPPETGPWSDDTSLTALGMVAQGILPRILDGYKNLLKSTKNPSDCSIRRVCELAIADISADILTVTGKLAVLGGSPGTSPPDGVCHSADG